MESVRRANDDFNLQVSRLSSHLELGTWNLKPSQRAFRAVIPGAPERGGRRESVRPRAEVQPGQRIRRWGRAKTKSRDPVSGIARRLKYCDRCAPGCQEESGEGRFERARVAKSFSARLLARVIHERQAVTRFPRADPREIRRSSFKDSHVAPAAYP